MNKQVFHIIHVIIGQALLTASKHENSSVFNPLFWKTNILA